MTPNPGSPGSQLHRIRDERRCRDTGDLGFLATFGEVVQARPLFRELSGHDATSPSPVSQL
jgi:hypothetical protein